MLATPVLSGCVTAQSHRADVDAAYDGMSRVTVGTVQSQIKKGMSGAQVAQVLGSPNIVSTDGNDNEVWIYDRISTDYNYSQGSMGGGAGAGAGGTTGFGVLGGLLGLSGDTSAGASSRTQKTLTIVIKYNDNKKVTDIAYHTSRF